MKIKKYMLLILMLLVAHLSAQEKISLTEIEEVKVYLLLDDVQYSSMKKIVKEIESIIVEDKNIINGLKERIKNDDEPGFFEKIKVKNGRDTRKNKIKVLIKKIESQLNNEQKEKFKAVEKPELNGLRKEEIFGKEN